MGQGYHGGCNSAFMSGHALLNEELKRIPSEIWRLVIQW